MVENKIVACVLNEKEHEMTCSLPKDNQVFMFIKEDKSGEMKSSELVGWDEIKLVADSEGVKWIEEDEDRNNFPGNVENFEFVRLTNIKKT